MSAAAHNRKLILISTAAVVIWALLAGCEGDPGQPGRNLLGEDVYPPTVELVLPSARVSVFNRVWLEALVYNAINIDSVGFLLDGRSNPLPGMTAVQPPYQLWWDASALSQGSHFIQAMAWDCAGRTGYSERTLFYLQDPSADTTLRDTLSFFDLTSEGSLAWKLPADDHPYEGFGVRVTMNRAGILRKVWIKALRSLGWQGANLRFEIRASDHGAPGELLWEVIFNSNTGLRIEPPESTGWAQLPLRGIFRVPPEFFVLGTLAPDNPGDTLSILTDDGRWRNGHSLALKDSVWGVFTKGPLVYPNPLIQVVVDSLGCFTPEEGW